MLEILIPHKNISICFLHRKSVHFNSQEILPVLYELSWSVSILLNWVFIAFVKDQHISLPVLKMTILCTHVLVYQFHKILGKLYLWYHVTANILSPIFDGFYSERTRISLTSAAFVHLKHLDVSKHTRNLSAASRTILLSGPAGMHNYFSFHDWTHY